MTARDETTANYDLITDLSKKIGYLKGYDYAYMLPSAGMMMVSHKGVNFMLTAEPISRTEDVLLDEEVSRNKFRFTSKLEEYNKRIAAEDSKEEEYKHE